MIDRKYYALVVPPRVLTTACRALCSKYDRRELLIQLGRSMGGAGCEVVSFKIPLACVTRRFLRCKNPVWSAIRVLEGEQYVESSDHRDGAEGCR